MVKHRPCCIPGIKLPEALKGMFMEMEDRMMLRKAEGEERSWSDSNLSIYSVKKWENKIVMFE